MVNKRFDNVISEQKHSQRIAYLDYARLAVAFLVIYGHLYTPSPDNYVRVFIYQFHMPFFFFVSGMLHKCTEKIQIKKYSLTLIIPVFFFVLIYFTLSGAMYHSGMFGYKEALSESIVSDSIFCTYLNYAKSSIVSILNGTAMLNGPCWFLIALFYCKIYMDFLILHKKIGFLLWMVAFVFFCYMRHKQLFIGNFVMAMPFYYVGCQLKNQISMFFSNKKNYITFATSFVFLLLIMKYNGSVSMWSIKFGNRPLYVSAPLFYINGFLGSMMVLSFCSFFNRNYFIVTRLANSLISILGLQVVFIFILDNLIGYNQSYLYSFFIALFVMLCCVLAHEMLFKFTPQLIGKRGTK